MLLRSSCLLLCFVTAAVARAGEPGVVIYDGVATSVAAEVDLSQNLWLPAADLAKATTFEVKPQGICRADRCILLPPGQEKEFLQKRGDGTSWFNLSEFARLLKQPVAFDAKHKVWCFGPEPASQNAHIASRQAPDFTLLDLKGKPHKLSDFRGKKVFLITWASW